jgi:DAK2 domain fusion protein YloV
VPGKERLTARDLRAGLGAYLDALRARREEIDRLNVYPVPDADTGTNMGLTVGAVVQELEAAGEGPAATAEAVARGALRGARGISGAVLSQFLGVLARAFASPEGVDPEGFARALSEAARAAARAVVHPVEGTVLTVAREAAEAAVRAARTGAGLVGVLEEARGAAARALARTPDLLPALRRAGVVDAGGAGLVLLFDALLSVVAGRPIPAAGPAATARPGEGWETEEGPRYEVACLLRAPDEVVPAFREAWSRAGESAVVAGGGGLWRCHLHTDAPGEALEVAAGFGRPEDVRVTDLVLQVAEAWDLPPERPEEGRATAVVAVATGDGVRRLFRSLGAEVVTGVGAPAPTPEELLEAIRSTEAEGVVLLPGDDAARAAAEEAARSAPLPARVVACRGLAEQLAALRAYDPEAPLEEDARAMAEARAAVRSGWVEPVGEGDGRAWAAVTAEGERLEAAGAAEAAGELLGLLVEEGSAIATILEGEGASPGTTRRIVELVSRRWPSLGLQVLHGGQPRRAYVVGVE